MDGWVDTESIMIDDTKLRLENSGPGFDCWTRRGTADTTTEQNLHHSAIG